MTITSNWTLTYYLDLNHDVCTKNSARFTGLLFNDGKVKHPDISGPAVDLLTIYFTHDDAGAYPSPAASFTIELDNPDGLTVDPIYKPSEQHGSDIVSRKVGLKWLLTVTAPTSGPDGTPIDYQLYTPGPTPPHKLKIRVKRQPSFSCAVPGDIDDVWGGEIPG